jgi:hypothetical protein
MRLDNEFVVPRPVDEAWTVLTDVERIAPCMPGAQLTEVVGDSYHGTVKVKVGPVVAQYGGAVRFTEMDAERHHVVLEAKGKERNGRGLASALVTAELTAEGGSTRVTVTTELTISGPLAQFGRGAIADVSARLLNQFVDRLKETVLQDGGTAATDDAALNDATVDGATVEGGTVEGGTVEGGTVEGGTVEGGTVDRGTLPASGNPASGDPASRDPASRDPGNAAPATVGNAAPATVGNAAPATVAAPTGVTPEGSAAAPADLLRVAAVPILKRLLPLLILIVVVIVVLVLWLG